MDLRNDFYAEAQLHIFATIPVLSFVLTLAKGLIKSLTHSF